MVLVRDIMIMLVVFGGVTIGFASMAWEMADFYNVNIPSNYTRTFSIINESIEAQSDLSREIQEKVASTEGVSTDTSVSIIGSASVEALKLPFKALKTALTLLTETLNLVIVPTWVYSVLLTMLVLGVTFAVLDAIFRRNV